MKLPLTCGFVVEKPGPYYDSQAQLSALTALLRKLPELDATVRSSRDRRTPRRARQLGDGQWQLGGIHVTSSRNGGRDDEPYFPANYGGERSELEAWMPIPIAAAREAARRFFASSGRCPDDLTWYPEGAHSPA